MKHLKKILSIIIATLFYLNSSLVFAQEPADTETTEPSYLFIQSAHQAKIHKDKTTGHYEITLINIDPWVIYFTERPHRDMGFMSSEDFLDAMKKQEKKFEPKGLNAAIVSLDNKNKHKSFKYIFTLHEPQYKNNHIIVYQASLVPSQDVPPATIVPPMDMRLQHVVLFIDACVGCGPPP